MFIAHLPAGYLLAKYFIKKTENRTSSKMLILIGVLGSILPDLDLFYFYLIDNRQHPHHSYLTHIPFFWFCIYISFVSIFIRTKNKRMIFITTFIFFDIILHLILDTVAGGIMWAYPLTNQYFVMMIVNPKYDWWVFNFILHWSFLLEVIITLSAFMVYIKSRNKIRYVTI